MRVFAQNVLWTALILLLGACSSIDKYNPFTTEKPAETYKPANSTEYQCEGNTRFFVRMLDKGNAAWLIYPDREVRLERASEGSNRYSNSVATLEIMESEATLADGSTTNYKGCKAVGTTK